MCKCEMVKNSIILKAQAPNVLNLKFGTANNSPEDDLKEREGVYK